MNELALFAGAGGGILGGHLLGWRTVCAVEWEAYPACVLAARQNDKILPSFPIWDDVQTFDGKPWRGIVDVVSGGFPCQDISSAGKGGGIEAERSGMWREMARIIGEIRPRYAFVENSPMLTIRGLGTVLRDLATLGYDAEWCVLGAAEIGANHQRDRIWIVAKRNRFFSHSLHDRAGWGKQQSKSSQEKDGIIPNSEYRDVSESELQQRVVHKKSRKTSNGFGNGIGNAVWWKSEPGVGRVADGMADKVDRIKALGNGQVPLCAATAWNILIERLKNGRN